MKINVHQLGVSRSKKIWLQICRYLHIDGRICFELSTFLDSPRMRKWGLVYMVHSDLRQSFGIISLLFFGYTISLSGRVSGEQRGGAAEILSWIGVDHIN